MKQIWRRLSSSTRKVQVEPQYTGLQAIQSHPAGGWNATNVTIEIPPLDERALQAFLDLSEPGPDGSQRIPTELWQLIASFLPLASAASLAFASRSMRDIIGTEAWLMLKAIENEEEKLKFLPLLHETLPDHSLCWKCAIYHRKSKKAKKYHASNNEYACNYGGDVPLADGCKIPFRVVWQVLRANKLGTDYGLPLENLMGHWEGRDGWQHSTWSAIVDEHLLMRVQSTKRVRSRMPWDELDTLEQGEGEGRFTACWHLRGGLDHVCQCAVSHIGEESYNVNFDLPRRARARMLPPYKVRCDCRALRRCQQCPSEYLVNVHPATEKDLYWSDDCLSVIRWADLGDGTSPLGGEWSAAANQSIVRRTGEAFDLGGASTIRLRFQSGRGDMLVNERLLPVENNLRPFGHKSRNLNFSFL